MDEVRNAAQEDDEADSARESDRGEYLLIRRDELVLTVFLPATEPLAFPQGYPVVSYFRLDRRAVQLMEESGLSSIGADPPRRDSSTRPGPAEKVQDWTNKSLLSSSIMIHQVTGDVFARSGLDVLAMTVEAATRRGVHLDVDEVHILIHRRPVPADVLRDALADLARDRAGRVTVFEVAVRLRIFGEPPPAGDWASHPPDPDRTFEPPDKWLPLWNTSDDPVDPELLRQRVADAVEVALGDVQALQHGYHAVTRHTIRILRRELLPPMIPCAIRRTDNLGPANPDPIQGTQTWLVTGADTSPHTGRQDLTDDQLQQVGRARFTVSTEAFSAHADLRRQALVALNFDGDTRLAARLAGLSAESLLDDLLLHLLWEERLTPEDALPQWRPGLDNRIRSDYHERIGGNWDTGGTGAIGNWSTRVADLRHRVVHGTYTPTRSEARRAIAVLDELVSYLCDRLAKHEILRTYPRTALVLAGQPGLERRGAATRRIRTLQADTTEPKWGPTFTRWREVHRRLRRAQDSPQVPDFDRADLYLVLRSDGTERWCLHDTSAAMAIEVQFDAAAASDVLRERLDELRSWLGSIPDHPPYTAEFDRQMVTSLRKVGNWREEYHFVPLLGVMLDQSDLDK